MPLRLNSQSADFADRFRSLLALKREAAQDVEQVVRDIIADVVGWKSNASRRNWPTLGQAGRRLIAPPTLSMTRRPSQNAPD